MDALAAAQPLETVTVAAPSSHFWAGSSFSFHDVLAAINPLQHIPIIGPIYRELTGDTIGNAARMVGDTLFGGVIGLVSGAVDVAVKEVTGRDVGGNLLAAVGLDGAHKPEQVAAAAPVPQTPTPAQTADLGKAAEPEKTADLPVTDASPALSLDRHAALKPLDAPPHFIPIDVSSAGIRAIKATSAAHDPRPIPLTLPPGMLATASPSVNFETRMKEGLDKYRAFLAARDGAAQTAGIDQAH